MDPDRKGFRHEDRVSGLWIEFDRVLGLTTMVGCDAVSLALIRARVWQAQAGCRFGFSYGEV